MYIFFIRKKKLFIQKNVFSDHFKKSFLAHMFYKISKFLGKGRFQDDFEINISCPYFSKYQNFEEKESV